MKKKDGMYRWNEIVGMMIVMGQEKLAPLLGNKKIRIGMLVSVALGVSLLMAGAITYLSSYGTEGASAAAAAPDVMSLNAAPIEEMPAAVQIATPTPTALFVPPTCVNVMSSAPDGGWTSDACQDAGRQRAAQMASFWTGSNGEVGCNLLLTDGTWITLK